MKASPSGPALIGLWKSIVHTDYSMLQTFINLQNLKTKWNKTTYW
jgi:hypothetical protein